jgi:hypothetical protein
MTETDDPMFDGQGPPVRAALAAYLKKPQPANPRRQRPSGTPTRISQPPSTAARISNSRSHASVVSFGSFPAALMQLARHACTASQKCSNDWSTDHGGRASWLPSSHGTPSLISITTGLVLESPRSS